jgi:Ca2+-binding RTX toxin-like protein
VTSDTTGTTLACQATSAGGTSTASALVRCDTLPPTVTCTDWIDGGASPDDLSGGNGNDIRDGGDGSDSLRGGSGKDTCLSGEIRLSRCEL